MKFLKIIFCFCIISPVIVIDLFSQSSQLRLEIKGSTSGRGKNYSEAYSKAMRFVPKGAVVQRISEHNLGDKGCVVYIYWSKKA